MRNDKTKRIMRWFAISVLAVFAVTVIALLITELAPVFADAGGFAGKRSYNRTGGGGSSKGNFSFGGGSSSSSDSDGGFFIGWLLGLVFSSKYSIFGVIIFILYIIGHFSKANKRPTQTQTPITPLSEETDYVEDDFDDFQLEDIHFSLDALSEKVSNLYVELQEAWESQKFEPMQARLTNHLYTQMLRQLNEIKQKGQINHIDNICVLDVIHDGYGYDETNTIMKFILKTRITIYTTDKATGEVISGDPDDEIFMTYRWTMIRSRQVETPAPDEEGTIKASSCPHCGAPLDLNFSAKCEYCGSIISSSEYDWVLSKIEGLAQE